MFTTINWISVSAAMRYFGLGDDHKELERIIKEYDIDVELGKDGEVILINAEDCKEPLFEEHKRLLGYRPDDPEMIEKAHREMEERLESSRKKREEQKKEHLEGGKLHVKKPRIWTDGTEEVHGE